MTTPDPCMVDAAVRTAYPLVWAAAHRTAAPDDDSDEFTSLQEGLSARRQSMEHVLAAALAVDPLRQADTVPVDRDLLRDLRSFLGTYAPWTEAGDLLRRLSDPDQESQ